MKSPFRYGRVVSGEHFTNRTGEIKRLSSNFENNINTMLISPRRWGKSSLVKAAAESTAAKKSNIKFCFIDLLSIRDEANFYSAYMKEILKCTSSKFDDVISGIKSFFKAIRPKITFGPDPLNDFEIGIEINDIKDDIREILNLPQKMAEEKGIEIVVCIDEFQNLENFNNPLIFQKNLRSVWQHHTLVTYCIYGSKRHMMSELFDNKSMPLYKFGDLIYLNKIIQQNFTAYISEAFSRTGKTISDELALEVSSLMQCHPYYVQQLAHTTWINTETAVTKEILDNSVSELITQNSMLYQRDTDYLSNTQVNFLKAMCDGVKQFSSVESLKKYSLGTSANVVKIKKALEKKEIIDTFEGAVQFLDPAFKLWFRRCFVNNPGVKV